MNKPQFSEAELQALTAAIAAVGAEVQKRVNLITNAFQSAMLGPQKAQEIKELAQKLQIIRDRPRR